MIVLLPLFIAVCAASGQIFNWDENDDDDDVAPAAPFSNVDTTAGPIRGQLLYTDIEHKPYYAFRGIPYAESPAFGRRFLPPVAKRPWTRRRDCFEFGSICPQFDPRHPSELVGDEDCLFLNVYTPSSAVRSNAGLAVMVYIHGGGFAFGSGNSDLQGPDLLLNRDGVCVVTLNYRLGVLGFMSLGTPDYSGNQGLKDQQLALRWIRANIARFGSDADRVTIFGQSAGSASCYFHTVAPGSRGLFQRTIQMSFTFDIWSVFERGHHLDAMYGFAAQQRYNATHYADLVAFLRTVDPRRLVAAFPVTQYHVGAVPIKVHSLWLPVVENSAARQPFLQGTPTQLLQLDEFDDDVGVLAGYTTAEALFYATPNCLRPATLDAFDADFRIELPSAHFNRHYNSTAYQRVAAEIRQLYFPAGVAVNANHDALQSFVQMLSNVYQNFQIDRRLRLLARRSRAPVFMYRFGLLSVLNYYRNWLGAGGQFGASHADDLCYVFRCGYIGDAYANATMGSELEGHIRTMTGLYVNFARNGDPMGGDGVRGQSARLRRSTEQRLNYLEIGETGLRLGVNPLADRMAFWARVVRENPELMTHNVDGCVDLVIRALLDGE